MSVRTQSRCLLRAGGTRGAFGSDGKAIQVGLAAAAGVRAALMAKAGARRGIGGPCTARVGFRRSPRRNLGNPDQAGNRAQLDQALSEGLGTHSPIEAAGASAHGVPPGGGELEVHVHPTARRAAHIDGIRRTG